MRKKIIYIDMDNTLADYLRGAAEQNLDVKKAKRTTGFFESLKPMKDAIESYNELSKYFDVYILTTSPWSNPRAAMEKLEWVQRYLPNAYKNVIISHHKELNIGDYLIDDSEKNGAGKFTGEFIHFRTEKFHEWHDVVSYIKNKENIS